MHRVGMRNNLGQHRAHHRGIKSHSGDQYHRNGIVWHMNDARGEGAVDATTRDTAAKDCRGNVIWVPLDLIGCCK